MFALMINIALAISALPDPPKFREQRIDDKVSIGYGLAIGDVDGDKKPDILLADKKQFVWYRNGDWKRFVMVDNITTSDNVCIAARDIDGDGKVEVAVGAQWNPGETSDTTKSGAVFYLIRPKDPTKTWEPVQLHHEPTTHRMRWVKAQINEYHLVVLPLHGRGNKGGEGEGVKVFAYEKPKDVRRPWKLHPVDESMHLTHNMDVVPGPRSERLVIGGKEGLKSFVFDGKRWVSDKQEWVIRDQSFGEVRWGNDQMVAGIEPMHGTELTLYDSKSGERKVLMSGLNQGHALAFADVAGSADRDIVVGWREADQSGKVGVKVLIKEGDQWKDYWIDENGMACEDLQVADLNGDGKADIIAAGRASKNLKIYWNQN